MCLDHGKQKFCSRDDLRAVGNRRDRLRFLFRLPDSWGFHPPPISIDDTNAASTAELFHARNELAIRLDIIAFRFHHHHEITRAFHIE